MPQYDPPFGNADHFERDESREALSEAREAWDEDLYGNGIDRFDAAEEQETGQ